MFKVIYMINWSNDLVEILRVRLWLLKLKKTVNMEVWSWILRNSDQQTIESMIINALEVWSL
jgi:hypothetical protein